MITSKNSNFFPEEIRVWDIFRKEFLFWCGGGIFALGLANILLIGQLIPDLSMPYAYSGDGLFHSWQAQRVIEGWIFENPRSGYPFGSNFLDYPGSDAANHLAIKVLGLMTGSFYAAINLYYLLGFFITFVVSYFVLRKLGLSIVLALVASFVFDFLPFHFFRINHLFYTWYFVVPVFFYLGFILFKNENKHSFFRNAVVIVVLLVLSSLGVYNAAFGMIVLFVSAVLGVLKYKSFRPVLLMSACVTVIVAGVLLNLAPNIYHRSVNGINTEVAQRSVNESEIYGFKLMHLINPRQSHRNAYLAGRSNRYFHSTPLNNENFDSSLGVIGAVGLLVLFGALLMHASHNRVDDRLLWLSVLLLVLFLFGTIGGLGSLFASIVTPAIRSWNRVSVFIAFAAIAGFFIFVQIISYKYLSPHRRKQFLAIAAVVLLAVSFYDQTSPACKPCREDARQAFEHDRAFVQAIEKQLKPGAAVYQLPYMAFPESPPLNRLPDYGLGLGFIHSKDLKWTYAGMKGRLGDHFFRTLAQEPIERQIEVIRKLGFSGIYIDRRGYEDNGDEIVRQVSSVLGYGPTVEHADQKLAFFPIKDSDPVDLSGYATDEILERAGYSPRAILDGIDFTKPVWPFFIRSVQGVSGPEPWGRWSDANLNKSARFNFFASLPKKFTLILQAVPFGRDGKQELIVRVGSQSHNVKLSSGRQEIRLPFDLGNESANFIEFIPKTPVSPGELGHGNDSRKLGIGFIRMNFELQDQ